MPWWWWLLDALLLAAALLALLLGGLLIRRRMIGRSGGMFDMSINRHDGSIDTGWIVGFAVYRNAELDWFRTFSLSWRPRYRFERGEVGLEGRRAPQGREAHVMPQETVIVSTANDAGVAQFAMSSPALTGLMAWLESSPPGRGVDRVL